LQFERDQTERLGLGELSRRSSIMPGVAAWLDAQGGLDTHSPRKLNVLRHTRQFKSEPR
jgi:hypothetical protein